MPSRPVIRTRSGGPCGSSHALTTSRPVRSASSLATAVNSGGCAVTRPSARRHAGDELVELRAGPELQLAPEQVAVERRVAQRLGRVALGEVDAAERAVRALA